MLIDPPIPGWLEKIENWIIIFVAFMVAVFIVMVFYFKHRLKKMRKKKAFKIKNPLVLLVSIGKYDADIDNGCDVIEQISDLNGIENDTLHMTQLFQERLGYDVYPKLDNKGRVDVWWNEKKFQQFIEGKAEYLLTSDHRKYSKLAVQRTFSFWPELREIPRFILYDCCSGHQGREVPLSVYTGGCDEK